MDRYVKKLKTFIEIGKMLVPLSTCKRLQVATIIFPVDCSAIYAIGYNGPSRGLSNDLCNGKKGQCGCAHAETNAIAKFNNDIAKPSLLYTTNSPCLFCAAIILNCKNIIGIIFSIQYRDSAGINLLIKAFMPVLSEQQITKDNITLACWKERC